MVAQEVTLKLTCCVHNSSLRYFHVYSGQKVVRLLSGEALHAGCMLEQNCSYMCLHGTATYFTAAGYMYLALGNRRYNFEDHITCYAKCVFLLSERSVPRTSDMQTKLCFLPADQLQNKNNNLQNVS